MLSIPDIDKLTNMADALAGSSASVENYLATNSDSGQVELQVAAGFTSATSLSAVTQADTGLKGDNAAIQASMSSNGALSSTAINAVQSGLAGLKNILNCANNLAGCSMTGTHVQKRISVAVVLSGARAGVGPQKAVWMSSLVTDPSDGLL